MNYKETISYLYNATPVFEHVGASAYKPGLQTTERLDERYGHPHQQFKTIHIAGTNGKGSCSHALSSILQESGLKVGLYTSPHLVDFRERIRVNGVPISEEFVVDFVDDFIRWNKTEKLSPSFFELTTALAFEYFAHEKVDIAVIEVGLGGRLDSTNIIQPVLSIITNISFDHTQFLGNTLAQIAFEKAGIIKHETPVVVGETTDETKPVFAKKAEEENAPIFFAEEMKLPTPLPDFELKGSYQEKNLRTILCAALQLQKMGLIGTDAKAKRNITEGLTHVCENTGLRGRWEILQQSPMVVCDTGHNVAAWNYLAPQIKQQDCQKLHIVFGMVDDKDIDAVLTLLPQNATYYFTQATTHRAIPVQKVAELAANHQLEGNEYCSVPEAYEAALKHATPNDFVFIGGSSYVVADLLTYLEEKKHNERKEYLCN
ncbi:MAG: bifunctional folylpolyglutamate synthase/dihydrofolate synthase [Prevotella sp.]|nr:bifunctional folylpolyglutamate synthase/dihydrofolate synthase [Prevotella sp.]